MPADDKMTIEERQVPADHASALPGWRKSGTRSAIGQNAEHNQLGACNADPAYAKYIGTPPARETAAADLVILSFDLTRARGDENGRYQ